MARSFHQEPAGLQGLTPSQQAPKHLRIGKALSSAK